MYFCDCNCICHLYLCYIFTLNCIHVSYTCISVIVCEYVVMYGSNEFMYDGKHVSAYIIF